MKKIITFEKKIDFPTMIGEITSISLEHNLKFIDSSNIQGEFIVTGSYKLTEASRIEEEFNYKIPSEIILTEQLDLDSTSIEIADFYYEIENNYTLICYIELKVEGVEIVILEEENNTQNEKINEQLKVSQKEALPKLEEAVFHIENIETSPKEDLRECDSEILIEEKEDSEENMITENKNAVSSLFENINESEETYATYSVYILREEETITSLINKYNTTKEELESYNDLTNLSIGTKIIIPQHE